MEKELMVRYLVSSVEEYEELKRGYDLFRDFFKFNGSTDKDFELVISNEFGSADEYTNPENYVLIDSKSCINVIFKADARKGKSYRNIATNVIRIDGDNFKQNVFKIGGKKKVLGNSI